MSESEAPVQTSDASPSVGMRLSQARQAQGLSLGEMARQLKLSVKQVDALERDDYSNFPGDLWVRGFLRNYAKSLGLNADQIVEGAGLTGELPGAIPSNSGTTMPSDANKERRRTLVFALAFVVLGLFVLALLGQRATRTSAPAPTSSSSTPAPAASKFPEESGSSASAVPPLPSELPNTALDATTSVLSGATPSAGSASPFPQDGAAPVTMPGGGSMTAAPLPTPPSPGGGASLPAAPSTVQEGSPPPAPNAQGVEAAPASPATAAPAPNASQPTAAALAPTATPGELAASPTPAVADSAEPPKPRTLRFTFTQSVNVEVTDAKGTVLLSKLKSAGTEKAVRGLPPFTVSVGNVYAVSLVYRGRPVDLSGKAKNGTARITLK